MALKKKQTHNFPGFLSLFLPGLGQFVKGQVTKGVLIIFVHIVLIAIPFAAGFALGVTSDMLSFGELPESIFFYLSIVWVFSYVVFWIWNMYDAYNSPV